MTLAVVVDMADRKRPIGGGLGEPIRLRGCCVEWRGAHSIRSGILPAKHRGCHASLFRRGLPVRDVDDRSIMLQPGQSVALVDRSGFGKSMLALLILALVRQPLCG
jgi:hypothetical protein